MMIKPIEELTFTDDYMFGRVMQKPYPKIKHIHNQPFSTQTKKVCKAQ